MTNNDTDLAFRLARERYSGLGVGVDTALQRLAGISISLHCWQGDDVGGFEQSEEAIGGGLVVTLTDETEAIAHELVRGNFLDRTHLGLDFFDASINRIAAWVIGTRALLKALLVALLEPTDQLREFEMSGDFTSRLAMLEELKSMPFGAIWDHHCETQDAPLAMQWLSEVQQYERDVLSKRESSG